jgi:hypothetical protein
MVYVYDTVIKPNETEIKRYGIEYTLENKTRMGSQVFYTFTAPSEEKLLLVPYFAEQYKEVEAIYKKFNKKNLDSCIAHIKKEMNKLVVVEEILNMNSETGASTLLTVDYKDIRVQFEFIDGKLVMASEFEIIKNNIFGNGVIVTMNLDMEEAL